jgi:hypothetical protein
MKGSPNLEEIRDKRTGWEEPLHPQSRLDKRKSPMQRQSNNRERNAHIEEGKQEKK